MAIFEQPLAARLVLSSLSPPNEKQRTAQKKDQRSRTFPPPLTTDISVHSLIDDDDHQVLIMNASELLANTLSPGTPLVCMLQTASRPICSPSPP